MTDPMTREAIIEAGAKAVDALDWSQVEFGYTPESAEIATAAFTAMLPHIKQALAEAVRAEKGAGNVLRDTVLERAARLIESWEPSDG